MFLKTGEASLADRIDALLPQTQCTRCGFSACRPYAEAIAAGRADINRCPPGGEAGVRALARLLRVEPKPLDPSCGDSQTPVLARIDESACIGCTLCLQVCPVDAIIGAAKQMHTVIAAECTGCALCVAPCPVDCIRIEAAPRDPDRIEYAGDIDYARAERARRRYQARLLRMRRERGEREARRRREKAKLASTMIGRAEVQAAVARAKARKASAGGSVARAAERTAPSPGADD